MFQAVAFGDDDDAVVGDGEAAAAVELEVVADFYAGRDFHALVDNGAADVRVAADLHAFEENGIFDLGIAVDAHERAENAALHQAAGDDGTGADHAVHGTAGAVPFAAAAEDEFGWGEVGLEGADGPDFVIEVEERIDGDQVHVGFVIGVERAHVAPVGIGLASFVAKGKGVDLTVLNERRDDVAAKVVAAALTGGILAKLIEQEACGEDVNAHGAEAVIRIAGNGFGIGDLLLEADDPLIGVDFHDAELPGGDGIDAQGPDGNVGADVQVVLDHRLVIHLVDMVAGEDDDIFGALFFQNVDVLIDGVGRAGIPGFVDALLGRDDVDEFAQLAVEIVPPALVDVAVETHRLVLREQ